MPDPKLYLLFTAATALGVLVQAGILLAIFLAAREAQKKLLDVVNEIHKAAVPVLEQSRVVLTDAAPKIKIISENLVETTTRLKEQTNKVDASMEDVLTRTRHQVARVDAMVGTTLDAVEHATSSVHNTVARATATLQHAVDVPARRISGVINGVVAAMERVRRPSANGPGANRYGPGPSSSRSHPTQYRRDPMTSADVAAAGESVVQGGAGSASTPVSAATGARGNGSRTEPGKVNAPDKGAEPLVPPGV